MLLVVRSELHGQIKKSESGENVVGYAQPCRLLRRGDACGNTEEEKDYVLDERLEYIFSRSKTKKSLKELHIKTRLKTWNNQGGICLRKTVQR